jgi:HAD superfamily hydrolase (TIGR01509 family)
MISCVLFDLDGVLVDACEWHFEALNRALEEVANFRISREDHITTFNGLPTKVKLEILKNQQKLKQDQIDQVWHKKQEITVEVISENACLDSSKVDLLKFLKANNIEVACVTNSIRKTAFLMLEKTGQKDLLDLIITNEDVVNAKPDPEGYISAMKKLNALSTNTLIVEDSDKGFEAAIRSNAHVLRVENAQQVNLKTVLNKMKSIGGKS